MKTSTYILWLLLLFATLLFSGCAKKNQESKPIVSTWNALSGYQTLFVLWDSLSAWYQLPLEKSYPMLVEKKLLALWYRIKVINGWESGDTSAGLKERLARITADAKTGDIALVVIGGNDGLQWLDTVALWNNLNDTVRSLQSRGLLTIIGGMQIPTNLGDRYRADFAAIYPRVARETDSLIIPFILSWVAGNPELNLPDGIHPNETGQVIVADEVVRFLVEKSVLVK
jgi:acyl-CoA thioesterase-1